MRGGKKTNHPHHDDELEQEEEELELRPFLELGERAHHRNVSVQSGVQRSLSWGLILRS